jgi:hypothetical protein
LTEMRGVEAQGGGQEGDTAGDGDGGDEGVGVMEAGVMVEADKGVCGGAPAVELLRRLSWSMDDVDDEAP